MIPVGMMIDRLKEVSFIFDTYGTPGKLIENQEPFVWRNISKHKFLSDNFIYKYREFLFWDSISRYQNLSTYIMRRCETYLDWKTVFIYQNLPLWFIESNTDKIDWKNILEIQRAQNIPDSFMKKYYYKMDWDIRSKIIF